MPQQDDVAADLEHGEEVGFVKFSAGYESAAVARRGEESLDFPSAAVARQFAAVLIGFPTAIVLGSSTSRIRFLGLRRSSSATL